MGSNCLDERSAIFGVGPITVDLIYGSDPIPEQVPVKFVDRVAGGLEDFR